jgi:hypothetical protein
MEGDVLSGLGNIFLVKGDDVKTFSAIPIMKFEQFPNLDSPIRADIKKLLDEGYELAVDDGSEKGKKIKDLVRNSEFMRGGRDLDYLPIRTTGAKIFKLTQSIGKFLPSIAGFSTPIGAAASGLLYAGTSKPAGADSTLWNERDIWDTPITAANRNLYDQVGDTSQISESFDRDPVVFDRYMQNKIQNLKNNEGIMRARTKPQAPPGQPVTGRHIGYNAGGIVSLRR